MNAGTFRSRTRESVVKFTALYLGPMRPFEFLVVPGSDCQCECHRMASSEAECGSYW